MILDPIGLSVISAEIIAVLALIIFVYPTRLRDSTLNLIKHGFLSTAATGLNLILVILIMIPVFWKVATFDFSASFQLPFMWTHIILGTVTIVLTLATISMWFKNSLGELGCSQVWKLMKPILGMWALTLGLGAFIHIFGLR